MNHDWGGVEGEKNKYNSEPNGELVVDFYMEKI